MDGRVMSGKFDSSMLSGGMMRIRKIQASGERCVSVAGESTAKRGKLFEHRMGPGLEVDRGEYYEPFRGPDDAE